MATSPRNARPDGSPPFAACRTPRPMPPALPPGLATQRLQAIRPLLSKWVNGTVLHYHFLAGDSWQWPDAQKDVVRRAFQAWKNIDIGLDFIETDEAGEAEVKIGFDQGDGSWSYIGTDVLHNSDRGRTTNYGWDLTDDWGWATALHEIGHVLGLAHEQSSPKAGIGWNESAVYAYFSAPPNNWDPGTIFQNILRKEDAASIDGSPWDPKSIMEYPFEAKLILAPPPYNKDGIQPNYDLSDLDRAWVLRFYPSLPGATPIHVMDLKRLDPTSGAQSDFVFVPEMTRDYSVRTVGKSDSKIVVFVERDGSPRHQAAADDSGSPDNAEVVTRMVKGERYIIRVRTHFAAAPGGLGLLIC